MDWDFSGLLLQGPLNEVDAPPMKHHQWLRSKPRIARFMRIIRLLRLVRLAKLRCLAGRSVGWRLNLGGTKPIEGSKNRVFVLA